MAENEQVVVTPTEKKLFTKRNFWCFALGTFGRDFAYNLFVGNLLSFILFTKSLTAVQFTFVSAIIIGARIFDALNDPIMGGIVENTRSRFGRFKPWILIGAVTTCVVIILLFSVPVDGWGFIGLLAGMYLAFSITYTMNDIAYWSLLPHLARDVHERNRLSSVTQLVVTAGAGLGLIGIPTLTTNLSRLLGGSAQSAYMWISVFCAVVMMISTLITVFGVQDHTEEKGGKVLSMRAQGERLSFKDIFRVLKNNDQLLISAIIMIIYSVGTGLSGGVVSMFVYFNYGYNGFLATCFGVFGAVLTVAFTAVFPWLMKKLGRTKLIVSGGLFIIFGYALMMLFGLVLTDGSPIFEVLGMSITARLLIMAFFYGIACLGQSCYYNMMFLNMSNTVEYNEWKTGRREESLIFSLRPFTAKMSSALQQLMVMIVYLAIGVLSVTNGISELDRQASQGIITNEEMLMKVNELLAGVSVAKKNALLICMCAIPIVFMAAAMILYKKKFIIDDATYERMKAEIAARGQSAQENAPEEQESEEYEQAACAEAEPSGEK